MAISMLKECKLEDLTANGFSVVIFTMDGWGACVDLSKVLEIIDYEMPFVNIIKVHNKENREYFQLHNVHACPTIFFYKDGKKVGEHIGSMSENEFGKYFEQYLY